MSFREIDEAWLKAPYIQIDPECTRLRLEKPLRVGPFASIGFPGFGYNKEETWTPKSHPFGVVIKEDAALQSHVTIHGGSWRDTFIGRSARLGSYSNIGHNARIENNVVVGIGTIILGSVEIEDSAIIWSGAKIKQHLKIGAYAVVGMGAVVIRDVEPHTTVVGNPARALEVEP